MVSAISRRQNSSSRPQRLELRQYPACCVPQIDQFTSRESSVVGFTIHVVSYEKGQRREHDIEVDESKPDVVTTTYRCNGGA